MDIVSDKAALITQFSVTMWYIYLTFSLETYHKRNAYHFFGFNFNKHDGPDFKSLYHSIVIQTH